MTPDLYNQAVDWLAAHSTVAAALRAVAVLAGAWISFAIARRVLLNWVAGLIRATRTDLDDALLSGGVLRRAALLAPVLVLTYGIDGLPGGRDLLQPVADSAMLVVFLLVVGTAINALQDAITEYDARTDVPIKSYLQIIKIIIYVIGLLLTVAVLTGRSPWVLMSGLGALMAVIILVFRDTILSLVASFTISSNRLLKIGDWIEAPAFGADGDVIDMALHTIKVQNWDKTITTIPTHKLVETSFKNWRGMQDSGGRRIKRSIHLDMNSVRFCDTQMLDRFERFELITDYVRQRRHEVEMDNTQQGVDLSELVNGRRLTNVGTFRAYVAAYLRQHPQIHPDLTFLIRQLAPSPQGLPLEIYVFTRTTVWAEYESIQADIFDHLLSVVPQFELRVFQQPAGADFGNAFHDLASG